MVFYLLNNIRYQDGSKVLMLLYRGTSQIDNKVCKIQGGGFFSPLILTVEITFFVSYGLTSQLYLWDEIAVDSSNFQLGLHSQMETC